MNKDLSNMSVQVDPCTTCPFAGKEPIELAPESYTEYIAKILTLESQHLCHSANNQLLCRGGRDLMLRVMYLRGLIAEPTDASFELARKETLGF